LIISLEDSTEGLPRPFIKSAHTLVGPNERVSLGEHLGGETSAVAQIAAVLARPGHRLSAGRVHGAVGGYLLALDFTHQTEPDRGGTDAQALMARSLGKQLPGSYPMGPFLATADEVESQTVTMEMTVNGVRAGSWAAVDLVPRVHEALVWLSRYFSFKPGDVVAIGPSDVTGAMVGPDDEIRVQSTGLGELEIRLNG
jgi:2-keto-4-pentenoate hydratase/2-oxohepta-3-ene-1,7-dioic acid hydratase in catechol pathway